MTVSIVVRLNTSAADDGRLAGEVLRVDTGEVARIRSTEDLVAELLRMARALPGSAPP